MTRPSFISEEGTDSHRGMRRAESENALDVSEIRVYVRAGHPAVVMSQRQRQM